MDRWTDGHDVGFCVVLQLQPRSSRQAGCSEWPSTRYEEQIHTPYRQYLTYLGTVVRYSRYEVQVSVITARWHDVISTTRQHN